MKHSQRVYNVCVNSAIITDILQTLPSHRSICKF